MPMVELSRVFVRLPNWLGDALLARPALHGLRAARPGLVVWGAGPAALGEMLREDGALTEALAWPREGAGRAEVERRLRDFAPQAALVLPGSFSSAWLAWRSGATLRVGYRGDGRRWLLTHAPRRPDRGELHLAREFMALARVLGAAETPLPPLGVSPDARRAAEELLERRGVGPGERLALIGPRSAFGPAREWPVDRFAALGKGLVERGFRVAVSGTAAEAPTCAAVARQAGAGAFSLAGETGLAELAALCGRAALVVCNDSGLAHLAGAAGAPTVQIYGSASSAWTAALGPRVHVVQRPPVCSPCYQRRCRIGYRCLTAIEVPTLLRWCDRWTAPGGRR
jgi:heptosyltransferase-2